MTAYTKLSVAAAALLLAAGAQAACYTVMDAKGKILSQTSTPPVDMAPQLHDTVPERYGDGATMVFGIADANCGPEAEPFDRSAIKPVALRPAAAKARSGTRRPLRRARRAPKADRG